MNANFTHWSFNMRILFAYFYNSSLCFNVFRDAHCSQPAVMFFFLVLLVSHLLSRRVSVSNWLSNPPSDGQGESMLFLHPLNV